MPLERITLTSDAGGSLPRFGPDGQLLELTTGDPATLLDAVRDAVREEGLALADALRPATDTPARLFGLPGKGRIRVGGDADLLLLDERLEPSWVIARGRALMEEGQVTVRGTFEASEDREHPDA